MKESAGAPGKRADKTIAGVLNTNNNAKKRRSASKANDAGEKDKPTAKSKSSDSAAQVTPQKESKKDEAPNSPDKKTAKKSTDKAAGTKSVKTVDEKTGSGSKTPQVMKLIEPQGGVNPVIIAGKSRIPQQLRGKAPLSRIMRREAAEIFGDAFYTDPNEVLTVNLTELVINENADELLRRFNACCCDKCIAELTRRAVDKVPSRFVRATRAELERGSPDLEEQKEPIRKSALSAMIRELIGNKRRHFHNV